MSLAAEVLSATTATAPSGWKRRRLRDVVRLVNGYPFPSEDFGPDGSLPLVRIRDLMTSDFETYVSGRVPRQAMMRDGDVVVGMDGDFNVVVWRRGPAALNQRLCLLRPREAVDMRFIAYALPSILKVINDLTFSTTVKHLSSGDLLNERLLVPSLDEQRRIADFLDVQTARHDCLVAALRRELLLLKEQAEALRDGMLASHARARRTPLMRLTDSRRPIVYGIVQAGPEVSGGVPYIKSGDLPNLNIGTLSKTAPEIHFQYRRASVVPGDIVMAMRASIGALAVVPPELIEANLTQGTARIAPGRGVSGRWLYHVLQTRVVLDQFDIRAVGTTFRTLNIWDLRRISIPAIPSAEQVSTAEKLDAILLRHGDLKSRIERQMMYFEERKNALVAAAVTGHFDVTTARGVDE
ncbi:restriction endonuclease subunit S [Micromonospora sp. NPDC049047]|uniref:restriction endonuclease subunit S n=1 Tax=Micromonospora sp. NPDC049047 TaxID=3155645 RepID=UPI0033EBC12D